MMAGISLAGGLPKRGSSRLSSGRFAIALILVALIQSLALCWMIYDRISLISSGKEVVLDIIPVDPRSLFRGDYVILNYEISRLDTTALEGEGEIAPNSEVFATLREQEGSWRAVAVNKAYPRETGDDHVVLRGRARYSSNNRVNVKYGIEAYFVPEGQGKVLEKQVRERKLQVLVAVGDDGEAAIKGLLVDGELKYEESLF